MAHHTQTVTRKANMKSILIHCHNDFCLPILRPTGNQLTEHFHSIRELNIDLNCINRTLTIMRYKSPDIDAVKQTTGLPI